MYIKVGKDPAPGVYEDGRIVLASGRGVSTIHKRSRHIVKADGAGAFGGGGGFGGIGMTGNTGGFGITGGSSPAMSAGNADRYNSVRDRLDEDSVVGDWLPTDAAGLDRMFRLMYHRDVAGMIVDLLSDSIWSDHDLVGIKDPSILKVFQDTMAAIDMVSAGPGITKEFLVLGRSVGSWIFDKSRGIFKDIVTHDPDFLRLTPIQMKGFDPKVDLIPSPGLRAFMTSADPRDVDARKVLPEAFINAISTAQGLTSNYGASTMRQSASHFASAAGIPLDPISTMFLARRVFPNDYIGTSLFTRLINFWALEKALLNATLTSARRRIRSILHLQCGIDQIWEPTPTEMDNIAGLFIQADEDPAGAVVATRTGVIPNELRSGTDFYKWSDEWTLLNEGKLRALGTNDALLAGDATYSNQESASMFFMERASNLRDFITQRMYYKRLFPLIARIHGFQKRSQAELSHRVRTNGPKKTDVQQESVIDDDKPDALTQREALSIPESQLIVPEITWRKELLYKIDEKRLDLYDRMEDKLPITVKMYASAANIDLDALMADLANDADLRGKINHWKASFDDTLNLAEEEARLEFVKELKTLNNSRVKGSLDSDEVAALGTLSEYLFWGPNFSIGGVTAKELSKFLGKMKERQAMVLFDPMALPARLHQHFQHPVKAEIASYILHRGGVSPVKPAMSDEAVSEVADHVKKTLDAYASHGNVYQLASIANKELKFLGSLHKRVKEQQVKVVENQANALEKRVSKLRLNGKRDRLNNNDPKLYSGVKSNWD